MYLGGGRDGTATAIEGVEVKGLGITSHAPEDVVVIRQGLPTSIALSHSFPIGAERTGRGCEPWNNHGYRSWRKVEESGLLALFALIQLLCLSASRVPSTTVLGQT